MENAKRNKISYDRAMNLTIAMEKGGFNAESREATNFLLAEIAVQLFVNNTMLNELLEKESTA